MFSKMTVLPLLVAACAMAVSHAEAKGATPYRPLLALDATLTKFASEDGHKAELVKLRYFAGLSLPEAAAALGISRATAVRHWTYAKTWLYCEMEDAGHL